MLPFERTAYFEAMRTRPDRAIILDEWIVTAITHPIHNRFPGPLRHAEGQEKKSSSPMGASAAGRGLPKRTAAICVSCCWRTARPSTMLSLTGDSESQAYEDSLLT